MQGQSFFCYIYLKFSRLIAPICECFPFFVNHTTQAPLSALPSLPFSLIFSILRRRPKKKKKREYLDWLLASQRSTIQVICAIMEPIDSLAASRPSKVHANTDHWLVRALWPPRTLQESRKAGYWCSGQFRSVNLQGDICAIQ